MSSSGNGQPATSGTSSPTLSDASSATDPQSNSATKSQEAAASASVDGPRNPQASQAVGEADDDEDGKKETGWLVTSCDVGTAEPRSISQELERLQVLKSYHIMDPERDEAFDRLTRMASRVLETPYTFLSLVDMGRIWFRSNPDSDCEQQLTRDLLSALARVIMRHDAVFDIPDINLDDMFRQGAGDSTSSNNSNSDSGTIQFRFFAGAPLMSPEGYRLGAVCMLGTEPRSDGLTDNERENLKDFAEVAVKSMVDRRKLTTQGSPSHLVACTAHDLITPLTGIQLSLSLLQQDGEFQAKLGDKRKEHISAAVRSSNMMLRICQSTIETLRGNRKIPAGTDWSLPRNLMQIAEASPFIDMKEFSANLEAISNSIPKRVPLRIILEPSAPSNIVSDGLKIFRSALNLLSNACSRANSGTVVLRIFDDQDGSLVFECQDNGNEIETRDSQSLFNQENDLGNFGLYSVAYQINWLGGKYGVKKRIQDGVASMKNDDKAQARGKSNERAGKTPKKATIFWFSIPIVLPQDVSELMGLAKSLSDHGEETSIPTFKADLPVTPPASPQIDESQQEKQSPTIPKGIVKKAEATRTMNALIIEDSTTVRKILGRALSKLGYQVFEAVDGMEGLRELKTQMFDIVLCDFLMPVMDGLDCVKQYREWEVTNRQVFRQYIVGISAHASRNDIERGLKLGMDDFKPKPIVMKTLTGLHESDALKAVRASLDNLLNLPSLEVTRGNVASDDFTVPIATQQIVVNNTNMPLFAIPGPRDRSTSEDDKKEDDRGGSPFAVPRRPSQIEKGKPPLFSIPPELTDARPKSPKGKPGPSPLFPVHPKPNESSLKSPKGAASASPLFSIPASKKAFTPSPLFSIPAASQNSKHEEIKPSPLFSIPPSKSGSASGQKSTGEPLKPSQGESSPLFAMPQGAGNKSKQESKPTPLFSIPSSKGNSNAQNSKSAAPSPLFAIPTSSSSSGQSPAKAVSRPSPLFSISTKQNESGQKSPAKPALFSIAVNPTEPAPAQGSKRPALFDLQNATQGDDEQTTKKPALFSISINTTQPTQQDGTEQKAKKPALFAIPAKTTSTTNPTSGGKGSSPTHPANQAQSGGKEPPLFSLATNSNQGSDQMNRESKKPPLFAIPSKTTETKKPPLFPIPNRAGQGDGKSSDQVRKPALFAIPVNPTDTGGTSKKPSLFDISGRTDYRNGTDTERSPKRPALFAIPGKADTESLGKDNGNEVADGNGRPKKAMKRALFDIAARSDKK